MVCNVQSVKKLRSTNIATRMSTNDGPEADNSILEAIHSQETCPSFSYEPEDHMSEDSRSEVMQTVDLLLDVLDDEAGGKVAQPVNVENAETIVQTFARKMEDLTNASPSSGFGAAKMQDEEQIDHPSQSSSQSSGFGGAKETKMQDEEQIDHPSQSSSQSSGFGGAKETKKIPRNKINWQVVGEFDSEELFLASDLGRDIK